MVPWTQLREPPLWGKCLTDLTFEFTHFNSVIRLRKVEQFAIPFISLLRCPAAPDVPGIPVIGSFTFSCTELHKPPFCSNFTATVQHVPCMIRQQACPFPAGMVSLVFGEVKHIVHLIRWNLHSCYVPIGA